MAATTGSATITWCMCFRQWRQAQLHVQLGCALLALFLARIPVVQLGPPRRSMSSHNHATHKHGLESAGGATNRPEIAGNKTCARLFDSGEPYNEPEPLDEAKTRRAMHVLHGMQEQRFPQARCWQKVSRCCYDLSKASVNHANCKIPARFVIAGQN